MIPMMEKTYYINDDVIANLREHVEAFGNCQAALADDIGCSESYLSDVLRGNRAPGRKIISYLKLEAHVIYIPAGYKLP